MGDLTFLSSLLQVVQKQSPLAGSLWLVILLIFRILVLAMVGGTVFKEAQEEFVCNTSQPGCRQVCYNLAFPFSQYRFWLFHILMLSLPPLLFGIFSMHQAYKAKDGAQPGTLDSCPLSECPVSRRRARGCYLLSVALRLLIELGFLAVHTLIFHFRVAPRFSCAVPPCQDTVDCYVSRPTEKTAFVIFYFTVGLLSVMFSVTELGYLLWKGSGDSRSTEDPLPGKKGGQRGKGGQREKGEKGGQHRKARQRWKARRRGTSSSPARERVCRYSSVDRDPPVQSQSPPPPPAYRDLEPAGDSEDDSEGEEHSGRSKTFLDTMP